MDKICGETIIGLRDTKTEMKFVVVEKQYVRREEERNGRERDEVIKEIIKRYVYEEKRAANIQKRQSVIAWHCKYIRKR